MSGIKGKDFSTVPYIYWTEVEKISYLQRRVIVYSIMYYQMNESCVSDYYFDAISRQLVQMQRQATPKVLEATRYGYMMADFDGCTGFDLPHKLNRNDHQYLSGIASMVYHSWQENTTQQQRELALKV